MNFEQEFKQIQIGFEGEGKVRKWMVQNEIHHMQADLLFKQNGKWCIAEVKTQEKFEAPPFDGHGLPQWQIDARLEFYKETGIVPFLIVNCLSDNCTYIQRLDVLMDGVHFKTNGIKKRTIFPIESFVKIIDPHPPVDISTDL
jgi:hypothetical protein